MTTIQLDDLDYKILSKLASDARKPYLEIARECGVSGAAIHQRIQKLYNMGVIKGTETQISPAAVGYDTCAFVGIYLKDPSHYSEVVEKMREIPEVAEIYFTTGAFDMFAKIYAKNNLHLMSIIHGRLQGLGLSRTETLISFKEVLKRQIPVGDPAANNE